jgi:pimeloyl-ACP methyl ester carboxylesterase
MLRHRSVSVDGLPVHVAEQGDAGLPAVLLLHGWPESWAAFTRVMELMGDELRLVAVDLPGIGESTSPPPSHDKRTLARYVRGLIRDLDLHDVTLVGHDVGGQIVYACLRECPDDVVLAVIMNVAVTGVDPWSDVVRNPHIWHFAFHAVPGLPELLVEGHQAAYFDYFFDAIAARPGAVGVHARQIYLRANASPGALHTGFEWYRAFPRDEEDNARDRTPVSTPVLYLRGEAEQGLELARYVTGLREAGLTALEAATIPDSGHFALDEQPEAVASALLAFIRAHSAAPVR